MKTLAEKNMLYAAFLVLLGMSAATIAESSDKQSAAAAAAMDELASAGAVAEYRQAGGGGSALGQQLLNSYPSAYSGAGYQYMGGAGGANGAYSNMLRQMYRPQAASYGLTDKVRNWLKSFLNRRQYVKPYYNPSALLGYGADTSKPVYINGASYKPVSVPLRQLQKYFKPFYGASASSANSETAAQSAAMAQYLAAVGLPANAASGFSYGDASGLYASESAGGPLFNPAGGAGGSFYGQGTGGSSVFGGNGGPMSSGTSGSFGSVSADSAFSPTSNVYSASGFYGSQGSSGSEYLGGGGAGGQGSNGGSYYGSVFGAGGGVDDLTATSSQHFSASTANGGYYPQQGSSGLRSSDMSYAGSQGSQSVPLSSGFNFESGQGSYPVESTYSLSYQQPPPPQRYSGGPTNFQPVQFSGSQSNDGSQKSSAGSGSMAGHSSSSSTSLYVNEKSS